ncbi:hypothetical protein LA080_013014 [Diaporthe eres]|nr:hypothetical protein LA080_013014 [Diaporthe eres]
MPSRSRSPDFGRSPSRGRSYNSRSRSRSRSPSRRRSPSRDSRSPPPRRNGRTRDSRSRSFTRSRSRDERARSLSRGRSRSRSRTRSESPLKSTKIVVERLTKNVTEEHLREIFGQYGPIDDMDVPLSRQFGTNRGAAYILYVNEVDAEAAIAHMHEAQLDGATISVSIVLPRRKFSPPPPTATHGANYDPRLPPPGRGGPGHPNRRRVEGAEDDTRRIMTAVAAQVVIVMVVAIVAAEVAREIVGVTAEQPLMGRVAGTCQPRLRLGQIHGSLMSQRTVGFSQATDINLFRCR